jgi:hypothetical protein
VIGQYLIRGYEETCFYRRSVVEGRGQAAFQRSMIATSLEGGNQSDASQTGMGRKPDFPGLGLLRMRMGIQAYRARR